jgi:hypothetical protein
MRLKIIILALIGVILLTASCIFWGSAVPIPPPGTTGDNSGGAIVTYAVYETLTEQDYYVQRISPAGDFLWGERGVLIGSTGNGLPWSEAVSDGSGGAIVTWSECLPEVQGEPPSCQSYVARIDAEGDVQWQWGGEGVEIDSVIADGAGGIIMGVLAGDMKPSLVKIDSEGNLPWGEDGVSVGLWPERSDEMASDNSGGVIVVESTFHGSDTVYAQRVDSQGNILWQPGGVQAYTGSAEEAQVVSDGASGAIIAYMRDIPCEDGVGFCDSDIYAQRIDAEGSVLWGPDGVPICTESAVVQNPQIVDDGAGGAIVFWANERGVCAQRVDADGHKSWDEDVELLATSYYSLVSDGFGGAISVWYGGGGISAAAQRIDSTGRELWGPDGTTLTFRDLYLPGAVSDGCGGVLISWSADVKFRHYEVSDVSYYVQRVDADGNLPWGDEGILLNH